MSHRFGCMVAGIVLGLGLPAGSAVSDDWPQWRGPQRDGKSAETGLLQEWPEGGPPLAWTASGVGAGYSSVTVADGRMFTMGDLRDGQYVFALNADGGDLIWKTRVGDVHRGDYGGSRGTPTIDGARAFVVSTDGDVVCLDVDDGTVVWRRNLVEDFGGRLMKAMGRYEWRFSESPLVDGDRVIVTPGATDALLVALNKNTGETIWRTKGGDLGPKGDDGAGYSSVVVSEAGGVRQYVQLLGRGVIGVDADSGKLLWHYNRVANDVANIPTPIIHGDYVFASSGYGTGACLLEINRDGSQCNAEEVYFLEGSTMQNHHGGLILHEGTVYTGTGHNKGFPLAVDFRSGKKAWGPVRNKGRDSAAITYADGRLYFRYQDGRMVLVEANPEEYVERGTFMIPNVEKESWAHPVIAHGKLLLREQDNIHCYDIKAGQRQGASGT